MARSKSKQQRKHLTKLERKAYHEAGHALIAYIKRVPFKSVTIEQKSSSLSQVWLDSWLTRGAKELTERRVGNWVMAAHGGVTAELVVTGRFLWKTAADDKSLTRGLVSTVTTSQKEALAFQKLMFIRVREVLEMRLNRAALSALVKELLAHKTLSRRRVGRIVQAALELAATSDRPL